MKNIPFKLRNLFNPLMPMKNVPFKLQIYAYEKYSKAFEPIYAFEYKYYFLFFYRF